MSYQGGHSEGGNAIAPLSASQSERRVKHRGYTTRTVQGWKLIAECLTQLTGFEVSPNAARMLARRARDPLPVKRWGRRSCAYVVRLSEWAQRQRP
jgi:hypothetical protein